MSISQFNVREQWLGTASILAYTFDFTIQDPSMLLLYVVDNLGVTQQKLLGTDTAFLAGVTFDAVNGGGTVTLQANLPQDWIIYAFLAPDVPTQPNSFKDKGSFTLQLFELALDYLECQIQRVAYLAQRSVKVGDLDDTDGFDPTLPSNPSGNPGAVLGVNATGTGFVWVTIS